MIAFKPVSLADRARIERYTLPWAADNCDMAFANMFCWHFIYGSEWAEAEGFLLIRFRIDGSDRTGYMQPVGAGDFSHLIPALRADAEARGERLTLCGLTDEGCDWLRARYPDEFAFRSARAAEDYIYTADDLRRLPGRRYQPKRNHINRFRAEYDFRYEPLTRDRFGECLRLEQQWRLGHTDHVSELSAEQQAMQRAFDHFEELGLQGGCIHVGEQLVAFTYGSAVNDHTFVIHAEKADTAFDGAFTIINQLFAQQLPERFTQINREEDLGLEGLRRAKLSYHPVRLQHKYTALSLGADERACKALWQECFGDEDAFVDRFLIDYFRPARLHVRREGERWAAMLHAIPFTSEAGRTLYIYGVATAPERRRQGLAAELLAEAIGRARTEGFDAVALIPADEHVQRYYARFGFAESRQVVFDLPDGFDFGTGDPARDRALLLRPDPADRRPLPEGTLHFTCAD